MIILKSFTQYDTNLDNSAVATGLENFHFFFPIWKKGNTKKCSNYCTTALISHDSKIVFNILQARLQQYVNWELPDIQAGFRKAEEPVFKLPTFIQSWRKQGNSRKISTLLYCLCLNPLTVWIPTNCGKFFKRWEYQTTWPASWETCFQVKKQQLEPGMEQWTGFKLRKEYIKAVYCHRAYLTYMQST